MENLNKNNTEINFGLKQKIVEALIFSSAEPISYVELQKTITDNKLLDEILTALENKYISSGVNLCTINNSYAFRTSSEVSEYLNIERIVPKPLSRAATETLAIIAYHQPITRSEIENIRGVSLSRGTIDLLLELGWIQPGQRRSTPGNPLTWKTSNNFLDHFGLKKINELPGIEDLKSSGLLDKNKIIFSDQVID
jgi:segregation and condensation protein B